MNLTAKSRYALKIMIDLALCQDEGLQKRHMIASRQGISIDFMDQILARLKAASLVSTIRGRHGGYALGRPPADISVWQIFRAVEDSVFPVRCLEHQACGSEASCASFPAWTRIFDRIKVDLEEESLAALLPDAALATASKGEPRPSPTECRAPRKAT